MKQHVLITGGAGFIGSHLAEHFLQSDWSVTALDDLSTGREENLCAVMNHPDFSFVPGSAAEMALLEPALSRADLVVHLAAVVGVKKVMDDTVATIEKNFHTSETVLRACAERKVRLLVTSTSEVYGANPKERFSEDDDAIIGNSRHRRWCYAAGKLLDEFHAYAHFYNHQLPVTIVRLFNTIGPRQVGHYGMVVPTFVRQALRNQPITIHGDGQQKRCFTNVRDVVFSLAQLAVRPETAGQTFNIGNSTEISIRDLAEMVRRRCASSSEIVLLPYQDVYGEDFVDMQRRKPDVSRLREAIGYAPDTPLATTLDQVIAWMREDSE